MSGIQFSYLNEGVKVAETIEYNDTLNEKEFRQRWMREKNPVGTRHPRDVP